MRGRKSKVKVQLLTGADVCWKCDLLLASASFLLAVFLGLYAPIAPK